MRTYASPVFQHRHYALIAKAFADVSADEGRQRDIYNSIVKLFERDNPQFNRNRFRDAANGEPNGKDRR